jgi:OmcA/MtrC family decaheme c-type cytochrome
MSVDACVVCHTGGTPGQGPTYGQIAEIIHGIHNSKNFPGGEFVSRRPTTYSVTYPTYMENCSVCHSDETIVPAVNVSALEAANSMPVTGPGCFSCHGNWDGFDLVLAGGSSVAFHTTLALDADCSTCHKPSTDGGIARHTVAQYHNGLVTGRGGVIWGGVDTSVTEGAKFDWQIKEIVDGGETLAISWTATYDGAAVNPCNATVGAGAPVFHGDGSGNLSMLRSYAQGDDFILGKANAPGQAVAVNVTTANTTCVDNVATTTIAADANVTAERGIVALQGRPRLPHPDAAVTAPMPVRAATPTREWLVGDGAAPMVARRAVVDTGECLKCHVGSLYMHGGNRIDNVDMCNVCHNPAANDQSVRFGIGLTDPSLAYDGKIGETYEMKTMLHRIHSAGVPGAAPYVVYRGRGIYAWATDDSLLNGWPGTGPQVVVGSNNATINHNFITPNYPRALNACSACHTPGFDFLPDQSKAMATTIDAGEEPWTNQLDDVLQGASAAACMSCHTSDNKFENAAKKGHAYQFGWFPQEFPEGRQTIIDAVR